MQAYIESLIWFGSIASNLLMFLNRSQTMCGWTILSQEEMKMPSSLQSNTCSISSSG